MELFSKHRAVDRGGGTELCICRGTPGDEADVSATELPLTYRISTLSFPLHSCRSRYNVSRIFLKGLFFASESETALERERGWGT